ncbi:MAG: hypothetical protein ABI833_20960, partial [Acidobacteriota bacterium]
GRGRPKGSRNKATQEAREIFQTHAPSLVRKGISQALKGDSRLLTIFVNRALGPHALPTKLGKFSMRTPDDLMRMSDLVAKKLGAGKITLAEALDYSSLIGQQRQLIETVEFNKRLLEIEEDRVHSGEPLDRAA